MNPYLKIARDHVPTEDLLEIISERLGLDREDLKMRLAETKPSPKPMTKGEKLEEYFTQRILNKRKK